MIYLDNASTTRPSEYAVKAAAETFTEFGNPSSLHNLGLSAEKIINKSRQSISSVFGGDAKNIIFTSGGTEANNTAVFGAAQALKRRGRHIITTQIEHPSVYEPFSFLENNGFEVSYISAGADGRIDLSEFENTLRPDTILVSCMHVNNETGVIQPVDKLKSLMKTKSPNALLHVDAVQSFCKIPIKQKAWGIDLMTISGHKIGALKGIGALYADKANIRPHIIGGGQQKNMRSGTENVTGIASFGAAAEHYSIGECAQVRKYLKEQIEKNIDKVTFNGDNEFNGGYILNVSFEGIKAEVLLHALERHGIYISTGSACSSNKPSPSRTLTAMGVSKKNIDGAVRFSLCSDITYEDIDKCMEKLIYEVGQIRKYVR